MCACNSDLACRVAIDGIAEIFNTFNSPNFTIETTKDAHFRPGHAGREPPSAVRFRVTF